MARGQGLPEGAEETPEARLARVEAQRRLIGAVREAFPRAPSAGAGGGGAAPRRCLEALERFLEWMEKNALSGGAKPTSPLPTAPPPSPSPKSSNCGCG